MDQSFILLARTRGVEKIINFGMFPYQRDPTPLKIALIQDECVCNVANTVAFHVIFLMNKINKIPIVVIHLKILIIISCDSI